MSASIFAQRDVTKFLGIPVDGLKSEMIKKLQAKGYVYNREKDYLKGEFNGVDVMIRVVTNNNKVWRILLMDENNIDESSIKIRFNNLIRQFRKNKNYIGFADAFIPEEEDISYEMTVNSKRYEGVFFQRPNPADSLAYKKALHDMLVERFSEQQLADTTEMIRNIVKWETSAFEGELRKKKSVWFMISELFGKYYITMYYDNEWNHSDGEEL